MNCPASHDLNSKMAAQQVATTITAAVEAFLCCVGKWGYLL